MKDIALKGVIHRDLKLANILLHFPHIDLLSMAKHERKQFISKVNLTKHEFQVKISDFGFAKVIQKP